MAGTAYRSRMYVGKLRFRRWNEMHYRNCSTHTFGAHTHTRSTHTLSFICRAHSLLHSQCNIHFTYYPARAFPASLAYSKALHLQPKGYNCASEKLYIISVSCIIRIIQKKNKTTENSSTRLSPSQHSHCRIVLSSQQFNAHSLSSPDATLQHFCGTRRLIHAMPVKFDSNKNVILYNNKKICIHII